MLVHGKLPFAFAIAMGSNMVLCVVFRAETKDRQSQVKVAGILKIENDQLPLFFGSIKSQLRPKYCVKTFCTIEISPIAMIQISLIL